jgi:hypothetical protein
MPNSERVGIARMPDWAAFSNVCSFLDNLMLFSNSIQGCLA